MSLEHALPARKGVSLFGGRVLVVTGTGTGVGKTVATAAVAALARGRGERVAVVKPAQTGVGPGEPGDLAEVVRLAGLTAADGIEVARFPDPLAPATAARLAALPSVSIDALRRSRRPLAVDVRPGARRGRRRAAGALSTTTCGATRSPTWPALVRAPLLLVTGAALGTLNQTALTLEALARRGLRLAGVVIGSWPAEPDLASPYATSTTSRRSPARPLAGALPAGWARSTPPAFAARRAPPGWAPSSAAASMRQTSVAAAPSADEQAPSRPAAPARAGRTDARQRPVTDVLDAARAPGARRGRGLSTRPQVLAVLQLPDEAVAELLALAHEVRMRWCGPEVEVEGIVSVKTGGCPEDCHFCSQSGLFASPVRAAWLDIPSLVEAAVADGRDRSDRVLHRRRRPRAGRSADGPDARGRRRHPGGRRHQRRRVARACSPRSRSTSWPTWACTATTTTSRPPGRTSRRWSPPTPGRSAGTTLRMVRDAGMEVCCGGILGLGETRRAAGRVRRASSPSSTRTRCR